MSSMFDGSSFSNERNPLSASHTFTRTSCLIPQNPWSESMKNPSPSFLRPESFWNFA